MLDKDQEFEDFTAAMQGVEPIKRSDQATNVGKSSLKKDPGKAYLRNQAVVEAPQVIDHLSSEAVEIVESAEELLYIAPGVQVRTIKRLRKGHMRWEAGIDLHGATIDEARDQISNFVRDSAANELRVLLIVHGKAYSQTGKQPLLKSYVNEWLKRLPNVLAFCSAVPTDGGTGAVYVLLKNTKG